MTEEIGTPTVKTRWIRRPRTALHWFLALVVALVALVGLIAIGSRYVVLNPRVLLLIEARTDGLKLGRIGNLKIEGLSGDIWDSFKVRRLTIADEKGVWLEASNVAVDWDYMPLFRRKLHAETVSADLVRLIRRPVLTPKEKSAGLPVSFDIDSLKTRLETLPAFSVERGDFNLAAAFEIERQGGGEGTIGAESLLHKGDFVKADFKYGRDQVFIINADAVEALGGPIAGSVGLPADRPFQLTVRANGTQKAGTFLGLAKSGAATPLDTKGSWGANGLTAAGRAELSASTLLKRIVTMFGPVAEFTATGRRTAQSGVFDLVLDLKSENIVLTAKGPVRPSDQTTPGGLAVDARIGKLSRIVKTPDMGGGVVKARLTGTPGDFTLKGDVDIADLKLFEYSLGRAKGPAQLRLAKRELTLDADLSGGGGRGSGLFATWMGASPRAAIKLSRLADGRLLIRSLTGRGNGFDLKAKGNRTLLGGLSFDGDVELWNLAQARNGAAGRINAKWSAAAGKGSPWTFTADATGREFATGMAELDRLLGPAPKVQAKATLNKGAWNFARLDVQGKAGDVKAAGIYGPQQTVRFTFDWRALGPFSAGPVEIAGKVDGDGAVVGTISEPRADLKARIDAIDVGPLDLAGANLALTFARGPGGTDGAFRLTSGSNYGEASGAAKFNFREGGLDLSEIDAKAGGLTALGSLSLRDGEPSRADLQLAVVPGAFIASGRAQGTVRIVDQAGGPQGTISLTANDVRLKDQDFSIRSATLTAQGPLSRMPYTVKADIQRGDMPIVADGSGVASNLDNKWTVTFGGQGKVNKVQIRTLEPMTVAFGGGEQSAVAALSVGGGRADINARIRDEQTDIRATLAGVDVSVFSPDLLGRIDGTLSASGRGATLAGQMEAKLDDFRSRDGPTDLAIDGVVTAALAGNRLTVDARATGGGGLRSSANLVLPAEASASPFRVAINRTRPIQGQFDIDGELQPIWDLFYGGARTLAGRATAHGVIAGTLNEPRVTGSAQLANGRLEDFATGLKLRNVSLAADLANDSITVTRFTGQDAGNGTLNGQGRISLDRAGASTFNLTAQSFLVIDNDMAEAEASGSVTVTRGADGKATLTGKLTIDRADIVADPPTPSGVVPWQVVEINVPESRADVFTAPIGRGPSVALDVTLTAPRRVFVRGRGLNAELSLNAHVGGTTSAPQLTGEARIVRGEYDFAGKRFEFDDSGVVYLSTSAERIRLNLTATREDPTLTAVIQVRGTAAKPEITLTSRPVLPQDEVLAQVLFGRSASQLTPVEAAQLAASLAALATGGGFDVIGGLRGLAGLDRLSFGGGGESAGGFTISGGKYLTDDVYLELTGGGREGASVQVEWRVRRNLAVVSRVSQAGDTRLSVRWRRESGRRGPEPAK